MDYYEQLAEKFGQLKIELVDFDNGATPESMAAYILVSGLTKTMLKDKGNTVLDLGNYISLKYGIGYEQCPEYHRSGELKDSVAFYISKRRMEKMLTVQQWLLESYNKTADRPTTRYASALYHKRRFLIQSPQAVQVK